MGRSGPPTGACRPGPRPSPLAQLGQEVADDCGFRGPGDHFQSTASSQQRQKEPVGRAPAHDVQGAYALAGATLRLAEGGGNVERHAVQHAANKFGRSSRHGLSTCRAGRPDPGRHVAGDGEGGLGSVDDRAERRATLRLDEELTEVDRLPLTRPAPLAFLDHPVTHYVFEEADRAPVTELVGEIGPAAGLGDHRGIELEADQ